MASFQPSGANGIPNGVHSQAHSGSLPDTSRPLSFRDSLPYSPQTSTLPFIPDLIPNPVLGSGSPALSTLDVLPVNDLDNLNKEATSEGTLSKLGKEAIDGILRDLKPSQRTHYKFRTLPKGASSMPPSKPLSEGLSPCAKALYDRVGGYFKVSKSNNDTPKTNGPSKGHRGPSEKPSPAPKSSGSNHTKVNNQAQKPNSSKIEVAIPAKKTFDASQYMDPRDLMPVESAPEPMVTQQMPPPQFAPPHSITPVPLPVVPSFERERSDFRIEIPSAPVNKEEYQEVAETLDEPHNLSRRKERQDVEARQNLVGESLDQRQLADSALKDLRRRTKTIIEATRAAFNMEPGFTHLVVLTSEQEPALTGDEQRKMYAAIQKVIGLGAFNNVPVEDLSQVLRLSEASLKDAIQLEVQIDAEWDEAAVTSWVQQLSGIDTALKAARTCARILTGGREDRQLYSETVIEHSVKIFQKVTDEIIIPLVGLRNSGSSSGAFKALSKFKKDISAVFVGCQKLLSMLAELVAKVPLTDLTLNTLEFVSSNLIFVENAYYEKESVMGLQKFDGMRSAAMDMLCQIFLIKPEQRQGIVNEILSSLSKLPVSKQSSRQFKLSDGGSIQPVSALVMRLVQASAASPEKGSESRRADMMKAVNGADGNDFDELQGQPKRIGSSSIISESQGADQPDVAMNDLGNIAQPLGDDAQRNAALVINFLVQRAAGSTKSGDTPYRNLLDLFVDDFTVCLDSPDWPAAETLLRCLMSSMVYLFENEKTAAPTKNMALEVLGNLSAAISRLRSHVKKMVSSNESFDGGELSNFLSDLASQILDKHDRTEQILAWTGPYRVLLEALQSRAKQDAHQAGASSFVLTTWAQRLVNHFANLTDEDQATDREFGKVAYRLRMMIEDRSWLRSQFEFKSVSDHQTKLSYATMLLSSPLCESFERMLSILLSSMSSDQATVRSKSLKSVNQVLETDPSILDGGSSVVDRILECAVDPSTQVRESALSLIGNCIQMRPALEESLTPTVIARFTDAGVSVRRRAMRLARDIYLRNHEKTLRSHIAGGMLRRVISDNDESVRDAARQMVEEIWFVPFYSMDDSASFQTSLAEHTTLIIRTVKAGGLENTLDKIFRSILGGEGKVAAGPFSVCSKLVSNLFGFINNTSSEDPNVPCGRDALHVLTIFAKAEPKLFTFEQIRLLKPQLASINIKIVDDLQAFISMVVILGAVLPQLSSVHMEFFGELRALLLPKMTLTDHRIALDEMFACLRVIADLTDNSDAMVKMAASALNAITRMARPAQQAANPSAKKAPAIQVLDDQSGKKFRAYATLLGLTAKHFNLDPYLGTFKNAFKDFQGDSVARLTVDKLAPFAASDQDGAVRQTAIQAIATVCHAWPRNYTLPKVWSLFQQVFLEQDKELEQIVLLSFKEFLFTEEKRSEASSKAEKGEKKSLTVMGGTSYDDVASATTQRFLKDITRICMASQDHYAVTALEVLASINRQGLTHPKETGVTLITLETSENKLISELAYKEHKALHEKHESTLEREYTKAVQSAYDYQRDIVHETRGARGEPPQSKLHNMTDVLKISKLKNRQRFMEKLCSLIDFDPGMVDATPEMPPQLDFTRFVVENMAHFDYQAVGELQVAVRKLEDIVTGAGAAAAQAIDSEIFNVRMDATNVEAPPPNVDAQIQQQLNQGENLGQPPLPLPEAPLSVEPKRLRQLATSSIILILIWETRTYLRRLYGMGTSRHDSKAKALAKDLNRSPTKTQSVQWEKIWDEMTSLPNALQSQEGMVQKCKMLVELMSVDSEFKVADEDDEMDLEEPGTPSEGDEEDGENRGRKRKLNSTPGGRKKRARSSSQLRKRGRSRKNPEEPEFDADGEWV